MDAAIITGDLVPMDVFAPLCPLRIDIVYAGAAHPENIFKKAIYHPAARLILHKDMARAVAAATLLLNRRHGWTLVLKDGLRPVEAQESMADTDIVRAHPHWLVEPRLLSPPGQGAHPRGMAVDVAALNKDGHPVDMGTVFDTMDERSSRGYTGFPAEVLENRQRLEQAFTDAGKALSLPLVPLPSEWWDFRFTKDYYNEFLPLSDAELPDYLKMCTRRSEGPRRFDMLAKSIMESL